jgi:class 3 adenylate cyclase
MAYVGVVGSMKGISNITVLGDVPNTAASFAAQAEAGEVVISEDALHRAGLDPSPLDSRQITLKGKTEPIGVHILRPSTPLQ